VTAERPVVLTAKVFERSWLDPADNQGVRPLLPKVRSREPWSDDEAGR
jgi:hypothetical protein